MGLPAKLKAFNTFVDGDNYAGECGEITLPKLTLKTEVFRGGGMLSELDIPMGLEKMELEEKYGGIMVGILRSFGAFGVASSMVRFNGAYQNDDGVQSAELVVRGLLLEVDPGSAKVGDNTEWTCKRTLSYLKWSVNGRTEIEIDIINNILLVDGFDQMAAIRAALLQ